MSLCLTAQLRKQKWRYSYRLKLSSNSPKQSCLFLDSNRIRCCLPLMTPNPPLEIGIPPMDSQNQRRCQLIFASAPAAASDPTATRLGVFVITNPATITSSSNLTRTPTDVAAISFALVDRDGGVQSSCTNHTKNPHHEHNHRPLLNRHLKPPLEKFTCRFYGGQMTSILA